MANGGSGLLEGMPYEDTTRGTNLGYVNIVQPDAVSYFDSNRNGAMDRSERSFLDANGDGLVTINDFNSDGVVTRSAADRLDINGDTFVDASDLSAIALQLRNAGVTLNNRDLLGDNGRADIGDLQRVLDVASRNNVEIERTGRG
ncbi:MAG: hypothetical protein ACOYJ2_07230 [Rickettsiales bacterium]